MTTNNTALTLPEFSKWGIKDIRSACEIGKEGWGKYALTPCPDCGIERWIPLRKSRPRWLFCGSCMAKRNQVRNTKGLRITTGAKNFNWKGGRAKGKDGYMLHLLPDHPSADSKGYVSEHRFVMEQKIGRYLTPKEHVHHINGIRSDNRVENLELISPSNHAIKSALCGQCELRKEIRLLRFQVKELTESLQMKLKGD